MRFTWDEAKRRANLAKHGLDFADAHRIFSSEIVEFEDDRFQYDEQRVVTLGLLDYLVVMVVSVERGKTIRIISMPRVGNRSNKT